MKAHLAVVSCATLMVLVSATVSACTGAPASSVPSIFSPSGTVTPTGTGTGTSKPALAPSGTGTGTATHTESPTVPEGAPETGGGGTAGLQDGLAIGLGLVAILAGLGSLAYRRRLTRRRR